MCKASEGGHLQVVELLLSKGAELDSRDEESTYNPMQKHLRCKKVLPSKVESYLEVNA